MEEEKRSDAKNNQDSEKFAFHVDEQWFGEILNENKKKIAKSENEQGMMLALPRDIDSDRGEIKEVSLKEEEHNKSEAQKEEALNKYEYILKILHEDILQKLEQICDKAEIERFCITKGKVSVQESNENNGDITTHIDFSIRVIEERQHTAIIDWHPIADADVYKIEKFHRRRGWEQVAWVGIGPTTIENLAESFSYRLRIKAQRFCEMHILFEDYKMSQEFLVTTLSPPPTTLSLHRAIKKGQQFLVKRILRRRPSLLDYPGPNGYMPLANAIICDQHSVIDVLLGHGANVHIGNSVNARTPLQLAFYHGRLAVARILLNRKALLEATDINDMTACHFAVDANQLDLLRFGLENGANVNAIDACGWSPLSRAVVMAADVDVLKLLMAHGANVNSKDKLNKTCVDLANIYENRMAMEYFAKALSAKQKDCGNAKET